MIFTGFSILTDGVRQSGLQRAKVCTQVQLSLQTAHTYTHACERTLSQSLFNVK